MHQLELGRELSDSCVLCGLEHYQAKRYLEGVANDGVNNIPLRQRLMRLGGYCPRHCLVFDELTHLLSSAILFDDFLKTRLARAAAGKRPLNLQCEACAVEQKTRDALMQSIKRYRQDAALQEFLLTAPLCLSHIEQLSRQLPEAVRKQLIAKHDGLLSRLAELIRKHDYRFSDENMTPEEIKSVRQALTLLGVRE